MTTTPTATNIVTNPRILVFDSGVGGLSIVQEVQKKLPFANLIYASDNAFFPYGTKMEEFVIDIIVIACNTASTLTLPHIRRHFTQPVVGVVPAIKPAAAMSKSQVIGLLATPATVARPYTHQLIQEYAPHAEIISVGSSELVQMAENKLRGIEVNPNQLRSILDPFFTHPQFLKMDSLVLACTHFPLLRQELAAQFSKDVCLIDSGDAIARRVVSLMQAHNSPSEFAPEHWAVFTAQATHLEALKPQLAKFNIHQMRVVEL
jgi:glutamate racemase